MIRQPAAIRTGRQPQVPGCVAGEFLSLKQIPPCPPLFKVDNYSFFLLNLTEHSQPCSFVFPSLPSSLFFSLPFRLLRYVYPMFLVVRSRAYLIPTRSPSPPLLYVFLPDDPKEHSSCRYSLSGCDRSSRAGALRGKSSSHTDISGALIYLN